MSKVTGSASRAYMVWLNRWGGRSWQQRFADYSIPEPNTGCILWNGPVRHGYGFIKIEGRFRRAAHVALELDGRPLKEGECALHRCDTPACVNAKHLFGGTQIENIADMLAKGRAKFDALLIGRPRQEFCPKGHALSGANLYVSPLRGQRSCRECTRARGVAHRKSKGMQAHV